MTSQMLRRFNLGSQVILLSLVFVPESELQGLLDVLLRDVPDWQDRLSSLECASDGRILRRA